MVSDVKGKNNYDLLGNWQLIREEAGAFLPRFVRIASMASIVTEKKKDEMKFAKEVYDLTLAGLRYLGKWKGLLIQQLAWKTEVN